MSSSNNQSESTRERLSLNDEWSFYKYNKEQTPDHLIYDIRPEVVEGEEYLIADAKPTEAQQLITRSDVLKPWILPTANEFINDTSMHYIRPEGNPGKDFPFVHNDFDDCNWLKVNLPHDWAINGPFYEDANPIVGGGMGRLPVHGVAWYRKKVHIPASYSGKSIYLEIDGAMAYAMVWVNGKIAGGWPYGYNSWRLDLTPYLDFGRENQLAVRIDNPNNSSRWYPGAGIYRNVWLTKTNPVQLGHWGTRIVARNVSESSATLDLEVKIENKSDYNAEVEIKTEVFEILPSNNKSRKAVVDFPVQNVELNAHSGAIENFSVEISNPNLWGPKPQQTPNLYVAVTSLVQNKKVVDQYETKFGIRNIEFSPDSGLIINDEKIKIQGVNLHHDLGALGAAFNKKAARRQLEKLQEMGCNAIRIAHNPPAPEFLELTDEMGFLVVNEIFDSWQRKKTPLDFHLIFKDWAEADLRSFVRRDRNHPSVIMWSFGNEVGEQYTAAEGAALAQKLNAIIKEEDSTRPTTLSMNFAKPDMDFPTVADIIGLNYQGEGIRQEPEFEGTDRIRTAPQYAAFHEKFPDKMIFSSETASAFSSRGIYLFPVAENTSSIVRDGRGGDSNIAQVSSYELYAVDFGASADKVFSMQDQHPYVAGEFVWTGWDHLGEPTPYYSARSSYCGIFDLAGFPKDRYYLYQSRWRPDLPMVHILPHWNWAEREGLVTPVHVFTSGDEAELFLNGVSQGRKRKQPLQYRLRWDNVKYYPGELKVIAYKNGEKWAENTARTVGEPKKLIAETDQNVIESNGHDLLFVTVKIVDNEGLTVPLSNNLIRFTVDNPGEIVATDNGDATDFTPFISTKRNAFNGLCLVIVKAKKGLRGKFTLKAESDGLEPASVLIKSR
ncbi:MAG: glycoside hydrolase family 2 protein [Porphyromonadaceae bacterium]|nr:glycoside hydrolase family 2 protein [Porphyromonadaceae bacterium]